AVRFICFDYTCNIYVSVYKSFAVICTVVSFVLLLLLLIPFSSAGLSMPSYIALFGWLIIGLIFFVIRYPKLKQMDNDKLSKLILNRSEDEVVNLINENKVTNQTHK